ncbi:hydrogenase maturation protease [Natronomonas sp.]|uniref:hydrogenase maturation protease n=1 Tax=Natronomonas sp. TaxID=2184060 RepID=UPI0026152C10|nr:hydrogenase maturation protease [Natronomonas sp.]
MAVVVGVGNPTMGDDGVARAVVRELDGANDGGPETAFVGTTALLALEAMDGASRAVVVDAIDAEGPPGTIHRVRADDDGAAAEVLMHDFTFASAIRRCRSAYDLPERVAVVGVVPARIEPAVGLSPSIERIVPDLAAAVDAERTADRPSGGDRFMNASWYCVDCEAEIEAEAVDDHERQGHSVRGRLRPERLLSGDPWEAGESHNAGERPEGGVE